MALIPIAFQIISALASSGVAGSLIGGLAGMLGGTKAEEVAKTIVDGAGKAFGTTDPKQIEFLIAQDKTAAERYAAQLAADTERYRIQVDDTKSARERDTSIRATDGTNIRANVMLIGVFVSFVVIILGTIWFRKDIPDGVLAILNMSCGGLIAMMTQAFNFEFGSSRGSSEKAGQISDLLAGKK